MKAKLGTGSRFRTLMKQLTSKGTTRPKSLETWLDRKKYGGKKRKK